MYINDVLTTARPATARPIETSSQLYLVKHQVKHYPVCVCRRLDKTCLGLELSCFLHSAKLHHNEQTVCHNPKHIKLVNQKKSISIQGTLKTLEECQLQSRSGVPSLIKYWRMIQFFPAASKPNCFLNFAQFSRDCLTVCAIGVFVIQKSQLYCQYWRTKVLIRQWSMLTWPGPHHDDIDISQLINTFNASRFPFNKNHPLFDSLARF